MKSNQKHSRCKKGWPRTKTGLTEKDVKSNGQPRPPGFDRLESCGHDDLTAKHCYFRCSRPSDIDGIKIFDNDDQAAKHSSLYLNVLWPSNLYQKFWSHQHQRDIFPSFGPLVVSLRLEAVSTSCWQIVSTSDVFNSHIFSSLNHSVVLKSN